MKYLMLRLFFLIQILYVIPTYSQNIRIIESFDKIPMHADKYDITSFIESELVDFSIKKTYKSDVFLDGKREAVKYEGINFEQITLVFYNNLLYDKQLDVPYIDQKYKVNAEKEFENLNKHVKSSAKILQEIKSESISFGEQDGKGISYYTKKIGDKFTGISGLMFRRLFDNEGTYGYQIEYKAIDVSKTEYDIDNLSKPGLN